MKRMTQSFERCLHLQKLHFQFHPIQSVHGFCCVTVAKSHHLFETQCLHRCDEAVGVVWELLAQSSVLAWVGFRGCKMLEIESSIWCVYAFFQRDWLIAYYIRFLGLQHTKKSTSQVIPGVCRDSGIHFLKDIFIKIQLECNIILVLSVHIQIVIQHLYT